MRKSDFIQLSVILTIFILYHFIYIFLNQESTVNSDTIWSYSFSRDLIEGVDLKGFTFPPFYYFLDIVFSFIPSLFGNYIFHSMLVSPINILIFVIVFSYFYRLNTEENYYQIIINLILSTIIIYYLSIIISFIFSLFVNQDIFPLLTLKNYFFMPANHGLSAVMSLIISYLFFFKKEKIRKKIILFFSVFVLSLSDFWFAVYFLPIIGIWFLSNINKNNLLEVIYLTMIAASALLITYYLNPTLKSYKLTNNNYSVDDSINILVIFFTVYFIPIITFAYLIYKKKITFFIKCIFFGSIISFLFIFLTDNYSYLNMRFYVFILPLNILLTYEILKIHLISKKIIFKASLLLLMLGVFQMITFNITNNNMKNQYTHFNFKEEISCLKNILQIKKYSIIADYWPGRIIFENLNREFNLISKQWIYNPSWANLHNNTNGLIVVKYKLYPDGYMHDELKALVEDENVKSQDYCSNKLIIIDNIKISRRN